MSVRHHRFVWGFLAGCVVWAAQASWAQSPSEIFVCYEAAPRGGGDQANVDLRLQRLTLDGKVGWASQKDPVTIANTSAIEAAPVVCSDGAGGAIVAYQYEFVGGDHAGDVDIVAQRVSREGKLLWNNGSEPVPVGSLGGRETHPRIMPDGKGGAFIVYEWKDDKGDVDIVGQRISADGKLLWNDGEKALPIASSPSPEHDAVILSDGQGGMYVVFEWTDDKGDTDVMAQRVSADGQLLWNKGEKATDIAATDDIERHPSVVPDARGGIFVVFELEFVAGEHKGDIDVVAQRMAPDGTLRWDKPADVGTSEGLDRNPTAVTDHAGGIIVAFEHEALKGEFAGDVDILGQRLDKDGKMLWKDGKESVIVATAKQLEWAPQAIALDRGGALIVFNIKPREGENAGDVDIMAQGLTPSGDLMWNEGKKSSFVASSKWLETLGTILDDGAGGFVCIFTGEGPAGGKFAGDTDVSAMRMSADGKMIWNNGERAVELGDSEELLERNPSAAVVSWK